MNRVKIQLTDNQKRALKCLFDDKYQNVWYGGGAWWGKSYLGVVWTWMMCMKYPWIVFAFVRDTIKNLKATTVVTMEKFYADYNIPQEYRGVLNEQKSIIQFKNGSIIRLLEGCFYPSDPLYNRFWSLELTCAFIEESAEIPYTAIEYVRSRTGRMKNKEYGIKPKILETFNPNPWHVYERYYLGKWWENSIFIESLVNSNNFISEYYVENLNQLSEGMKKRLLRGERDFDDNVWMMFRASDMEALRTNEESWDTYYIVCDVARFWKDTTRISLWKGNTRLRVLTYEKSSVEETKTAILLLAEQYGVDHRNIIIDSDGVWGWVVDGISYATGFVNNARPVETWTKQNYGNLKSQCAFELKRRLENHEIAIRRDHEEKDKDWELLKQEMMNTYIDEKSIDGKTKIEAKEKMKERIGRSPDLLDTLIMRMYGYLRGLNDIDTYLSSITR